MGSPADPDRWWRVRSLYEEVVELPEAERCSRLAATAEEDAEAASGVRRLLEAESAIPEDFLEPVGAALPARLDVGALHGRRLGPFQLLRVLGTGGMGAVWESEQESPRRLVALKVLRLGIANEQALVRFRREAELLARLRHPGIAQVYEAGVHSGEDGFDLPWFAMERVEGAREILRHVAEERLGDRERLELFLQVCDAIQHAHQRGVVHRDLKSSNVLVDGEGRAKVIDFGVALALGRDAAEPHLTLAGQAVGTLASMSPEQLTGDTEALDARTDVYALGVLLHELLVGAPPHDVTGLPLHEVVARVSAGPSRRPRELRRDLPEELDWILLRALEPEAEQRYASASELAADVRRHLSDEPVEARPPSAFYQLRKMARHHRALFTGAAAVTAALAAGAAVSTTLWLRAAAERDETRWAAYVATLASAQASLLSFDVAEAGRWLEETPPELRGWEWRHLASRLDRSRRTMEATSSPGHLVAVKDVVWAPGGRLFTGADDGTLAAFDSATGELLWKMRRHRHWIHDLDLSPDHAVLASASQDGSVLLHDADGRLLGSLEHGEPVTGVHFDPAGTELLTVSRLGVARRWPVAGGEPHVVARLGSHAAASATSPDGALLAVALGGGDVRLLDARTGESLSVHREHAEALALDFDPRGGMLAVARSDGRIEVLDVASGRARSWTGHRDAVHSIGFSQDGRVLASGGNDQPAILLWDPETGRRNAVLLGHSSSVKAISFGPADGVIASGARDGTVRLWDPAADDVRTLRGHVGWIYDLDFHPGELLLASAEGHAVTIEGTSRVWDLRGNGEIARLVGERSDGLRPHVWDARWLPDGRRLVVAQCKGPFQVWSVEEGATAATATSADITFLSVDPLGRHVALGWRGADHVPLMDPTSGALLGSLGGIEELESIAHVASGRRLAAGERGGRIRIFDIENLVEVAALAPPAGLEDRPVREVRESPDGRAVAALFVPDVVVVWNLERPDRPLLLRTGWAGDDNCLAFSPDGERLFVAAGSTVQVWEPSSGRHVLSLYGHGGHVECVAVSPDGSVVASGSADATIRLWEAP